EEFIAAVATGNGKLPEDQWDITVETMDLSEFQATVKVTSVHLVDVCQLGKVDGRWRIFNVIWTVRKKPV
ncbi:MAG: nuclear transport factor 2 family protein, partial [Sphingomonadales bacterium]